MKSVSRQWAVQALLLPFVVGVAIAASRWGKDSLPQMILFPSLVVGWRLFARSNQRPFVPEGENKALADYAIKNWHAMDMLALLVLFAFEAGMVGMAEAKVVAPHLWALFLATVYLPYTLLSLWSHSFLQQAQRLIHEQAEPTPPGEEG